MRAYIGGLRRQQSSTPRNTLGFSGFLAVNVQLNSNSTMRAVILLSTLDVLETNDKSSFRAIYGSRNSQVNILLGRLIQ